MYTDLAIDRININVYLPILLILYFIYKLVLSKFIRLKILIVTLNELFKTF